MLCNLVPTDWFDWKCLSIPLCINKITAIIIFYEVDVFGITICSCELSPTCWPENATHLLNRPQNVISVMNSTVSCWFPFEILEPSTFLNQLKAKAFLSLLRLSRCPLVTKQDLLHHIARSLYIYTNIIIIMHHFDCSFIQYLECVYL